MTDTATTPNRRLRPWAFAGAFAGIVFTAVIALWAHYGAAIFYEMVLAGIALCF